MSFLVTFRDHPRKLWLRRALFQVHLWAGVLLSLYVIVVALTGSVLVFRAELNRVLMPAALCAYDVQRLASIDAVVQRFGSKYPGAQLDELQTPSAQLPAFVLTGTDDHKQPFRIYADAVTAQLYPSPRSWLDQVYDLHVYLLLGHAYGMQLNAAAAAVLLLLSLTGLFLWWSGIKIWVRGLRIDLARNWRRINFDLHNAVGFWTLLIVCWWSISGVYFGWYRQVAAAINVISPLQGMRSPALPKLLPSKHRVTLDQLLDAAHRASPSGRIFSISDPMLHSSIVYVLMDLRAPGDFSHRDIISLSTADARILTRWSYGENHTAGDWILWAMHPLHFGTLWGFFVKLIWSSCGLALALLAISGLLMYWNRYLRHRFWS